MTNNLLEKLFDYDFDDFIDETGIMSLEKDMFIGNNAILEDIYADCFEKLKCKCKFGNLNIFKLDKLGLEIEGIRELHVIGVEYEKIDYCYGYKMNFSVCDKEGLDAFIKLFNFRNDILVTFIGSKLNEALHVQHVDPNYTMLKRIEDAKSAYSAQPILTLDATTEELADSNYLDMHSDKIFNIFEKYKNARDKAFITFANDYWHKVWPYYPLTNPIEFSISTQSSYLRRKIFQRIFRSNLKFFKGIKPYIGMHYKDNFKKYVKNYI